ncbi:zinc finger CCCH domain-containing protein 7B-like [Aulostomus maculatus]
MDPVRQKRKDEIGRALLFIQSSLAYPEPEGYQDFLIQLVRSLLDEGNSLVGDGAWEQAAREFSEALNVSHYASAEGIQIPPDLLESLYVSRATAYLNMEEYEVGLKDCDSALEVCKESCSALYRKALCLKELGKFKEAYNCTTDCLLISRLDKQVNELAQELAEHLGLRNRKPYISTKVSDDLLGSTPSMPHSTPAVKSGCRQPTNLVPNRVNTVDDSELIGDDLDSLLDFYPREQEPTKVTPSVPSRTGASKHTAPVVLPAPTPQLPPAFFNSAISQLNSLDSLTSGGCSTLDALDDLSVPQSLDALDDFSSGGVDVPILGLTPSVLNDLDGLDSLDDFRTELALEEKSLVNLLDKLNSLETVSDSRVQIDSVPPGGVNAVNQLDSLDALDSFPSVEGGSSALPMGANGLNTLHVLNSTASHTVAPATPSPKNNCNKQKKDKGSVLNPLSSTHEFMQACSTCFPREGQGIHTFVHKLDLVHSCKRDILLSRRKADVSSEWTRVRPLPSWRSFSGPFVLCKELQKSEVGLCKYGEKCNFAFNQLEIDVWTEERKGALDRKLLFEPAEVKLDPVINIIRLLQEHRGMFIFLCQECYDGKPRIISKRCPRNPTVCSNLDVRHNFDANKCLAFVVRTLTVDYKKIRPLRLLCHFDLCHQAIRYGCQREDSCLYAHSVIELKTWRVQKDTGISCDEMVKVSTKYYEKEEQNSGKHKANRLSGGNGASKSRGGGRVEKSLNMNMKFACGQCWSGSRISEPDKDLKYCTAKARHVWSKERRLLLVKSLERNKWTQVRPLPHAKNFPTHYDLCTQMLEKKKCSYSGNCTFAHSPEERDMWMYMKNEDLRDMQQMYDMWLTLTSHNQPADGATLSQLVSEEKCIVMPTDHAEPTSGFHCHLCGKHSNSERQWQQHISTEKHKDRVFSCEGEEEVLKWSYRFPGKCLELCPKWDSDCPDTVGCDYAHSLEELQEWRDRQYFLRQKLARARENMLIMPEDSDFGKYNFLLQD